MKQFSLGRVRKLSRAALESESGAAAVEFAVWLLVLAYPMVNVVDLGLYAYQRMELQNSAQMAVQSAFNTCSQKFATPVFSKCNAANSNAGAGTTAVSNGAHSTSLGTSVSVTDTSECLDNVIQSGAQTTCPTSSGDYVGVTASYSFTPLFRLASITSLLPATIAQTHWIRMN